MDILSVFVLLQLDYLYPVVWNSAVYHYAHPENRLSRNVVRCPDGLHSSCGNNQAEVDANFFRNGTCSTLEDF